MTTHVLLLCEFEYILHVKDTYEGIICINHLTVNHISINVESNFML